MTEAEWLACEDPERMLHRLGCEMRFATRRVPAFAAAFAESEQVRALLAPSSHEPFVAFARWVYENGPHPAKLHPYPQCSDPLEFQRLHPSYRTLGDVVELLVTVGAVTWLDVIALVRADASRRESSSSGAHLNSDAVERYRYQAERLRDIVGPLPFRPVHLDPEWRTANACTLASQMYESRDFSAMPILADALQDAGCDNPDILTHCRDATQVHVRGCWVVDLVLGKS